MTGDLFAPLTSSDALIEATGDRAWLAAMLAAEAALARAEAAAGVIPAAAAEAITAACRAEGFDAASIGRRSRPGANPAIPLVADLRAAVPAAARAWVHWGATSQDIVDTAAMLVTRQVLTIMDDDLARLVRACAALAREHRDTPMAARTLLQQALPTTFGAKAAGWLAAAMDAGDQLDRLRPRLAVQLGGAAGTLAALGPAGPEVMARMAVDLDLAEPLLPWHADRGRIAQVAGALAHAAGMAAKVALDVVLMAQTEVAEVTEGAGGTGHGGSSTLPHKRNPAGSVAVLAAARRAAGLCATLLGGMAQEHERGAGGWQAEWATLADALTTAGGAVAGVALVVADLRVDPAAMRANLEITGGLLLAERVTFALAATVDRTDASAAVAAAAARATAAVANPDTGPTGRPVPTPSPFATELAADPVVGAALDEEEIARLLQPEGYLGAAATMVDRVLEAYDAWGTR